MAAEITSWYELNSDQTWGDEKPTLNETRIHAKCLRSITSVRDYFRVYRANKRQVPETRRTSSSSITSSEGLDSGDSIDNSNRFKAESRGKRTSSSGNGRGPSAPSLISPMKSFITTHVARGHTKIESQFAQSGVSTFHQRKGAVYVKSEDAELGKTGVPEHTVSVEGWESEPSPGSWAYENEDMRKVSPLAAVANGDTWNARTAWPTSDIHTYDSELVLQPEVYSLQGLCQQAITLCSDDSLTDVLDDHLQPDPMANLRSHTQDDSLLSDPAMLKKRSRYSGLLDLFEGTGMKRTKNVTPQLVWMPDQHRLSLTFGFDRNDHFGWDVDSAVNTCRVLSPAIAELAGTEGCVPRPYIPDFATIKQQLVL